MSSGARERENCECIRKQNDLSATVLLLLLLLLDIHTAKHNICTTKQYLNHSIESFRFSSFLQVIFRIWCHRQNVVTYRIVSMVLYHMVSYLIVSYHIVSYCILSYRNVSYSIWCHRQNVVTWAIVLYHILSYRIMSYSIEKK